MKARSTCLSVALAVLALLGIHPASVSAKVIASAGSGPGQTLNPSALGVDFETGRLYIADTGNDRVDIFDSAGTFVKSFAAEDPTAIAVDNDPASTSQHDVYVVDAADSTVKKFGSEGEFKLTFGSPGEGEGQLSKAGRILIGVGPAGTVYVIDSIKVGEEFTQRLQKFSSTGVFTGPQHALIAGAEFSAQSAAVDLVSGDLYLAPGGEEVKKYSAAGNLIASIPNSFEAASLVSVQALAVDASQNLFAVSSELGSKVSVMEFNSTGTRLRRFGYGSLNSVATGIAPSFEPGIDGVYISEAPEVEPEGNRVVQALFPSPGPLIFPEACTTSHLGASTIDLGAEVNPEGKATTYHFEYIDQKSFESEGGFSSPSTKKTPESASAGEDFKLHLATVHVTGLVPETEYRCRVVATNADAPGGREGPTGAFKTLLAPEIRGIWTSDVEQETATLEAEVNPLSTPGTTGYFEYVDDAAFQANGFTDAKKVPASEPLDFGSGEAAVVQGATISGLSAGVVYHFRFVGTNELISPKEVIGESKTFRTYSAGQGALPDSRAYELVSPPQKNSAEVAIPGPAAGVFNKELVVRVNAAASSGEAVTYTSWTSFGLPAGASSASQYLSKRSAAGWETDNISPQAFIAHPLDLPYRGFSPDLRFGAFVTSEPPLTPEAQPGIDNLYLRNNDTGSIQALTIEEPQLAGGPDEPYCSGYAGTSADGTHAIFSGRGALPGTGALVGPGFSLYEWSAAKGLALVSVLPDDNPAPPVKVGESPRQGTGFGAVGGNCIMDQAPIRNAISADGSVIFWTYGGDYEGAEHPLFARIHGTETIQVDGKPAEKPGIGPYGNGEFWAANSSGSMVIFTAPGLLTSAAKAPNQLYRFDTSDRTLKDLTPGKVDPKIKGVIGTSEDGSYAYFVGAGALTKEEENATGQKAVEGANNLYLSHEGVVRFIGRLSELDQEDWSLAPEGLTARVTPDGRYLAFLSVETQALSHYDNLIAGGQHCQRLNVAFSKLEGDPHCAEAYLYDADANALTCASCNPAGSRPVGPAGLPTWSNPYEGPRYLSDDGSRLFFESGDVLSSADQNGRRDVYEFERGGGGSCNTGSVDFVASAGGCISLLSSGKSSDETYLIDASADARDAFFATRSVLSGWDTNENYDIYDAREGGGFPEPPQVSKCEGEACKLPPPPTPTPASPATPAFQGPGNPKLHKAKSKHGGHKRHKGKNKKGHKAESNHKRAGEKGRTGR